MVSEKIKYFSLRKICRSGQVFRMYERETGHFDVYSGVRHLRAVQQGDRVDFHCSREEFDGYWRRYFDLDRDYAKIVESVSPEDGFLKAACGFGCDIRILHQDIWEMMVTFIISQQKQIPSIRKCVEALCERFGEKMNDGEGTEWYAFPTPQSIAAGGPDGLKGLSLGYRERYIYETAVRFLEKGIPDNELEAMNYEAAKAYLLEYTGIGEKVANCILLFGAAFVDAFPIDTHIKDILFREYYCRYEADGCNGVSDRDALSTADYRRLIDKFFGRYAGSRGIVQQWIFAYEVN